MAASKETKQELRLEAAMRMNLKGKRILEQIL